MIKIYRRLWQINWAEQWQYRANLLMYLLYWLVYRIIKAEGFNLDRMKSKIKSHHHRMKRQVSIDDYVAMFEWIYNLHVSPDEIVPLAINTKKAMKEKANGSDK